MTKLCPKCHFIGKGKYYGWFYDFFLANIYLGITLVVVVLYNITDEKLSEIDMTWYGFMEFILIIVILMIPALWGVINILNYLRGGKTCPKCQYSDMLNLDDPDALTLIKKYDLRPGVNTAIEQDKSSDPS